MAACILGAGLFISMGLSLVGCNPKKTEATAPEAGDVAVARIHDEVIWKSDVQNEAVSQGLIGQGEPLDITSDLFRRVLEDVIDEKILAQEALRRGLDRSSDAKRRLQAARERVLGDLAVETAVDRSIDEAKVRALYNEELKLWKQSDEIRARLILARTRPEAEALIKQLQGGAVFEAMAMERSIDQTTRFNGGDMGYFTTDILPQTYKAALEHAQKGQLVGPIQVDSGFAILRVEDRRPETPPTFDEARPQILRFLTYDQVGNLLNRLRNGARPTLLIKSLERSGEEVEPASAPKAAFEAAPSASAAEGATTPLDAESTSSASALPPPSSGGADASRGRDDKGRKALITGEAAAEAERLRLHQRVHKFLPPADARSGGH